MRLEDVRRTLEKLLHTKQRAWAGKHRRGRAQNRWDHRYRAARAKARKRQRYSRRMNRHREGTRRSSATVRRS